MEPKISVIVPVFNVEKYLRKCVDSIIDQSYKNLEIILVNDGSLDESGQISDSYSKIDSRVLVIHQENMGLSGARNSGLEIASGDYIAFVDSDDWVELDMYKTMIEIALSHGLDMIECGINVPNGEEKSIPKNAGSLEIENANQVIKRILISTQFSVCTKLFKKSIINGSRFLLNKTSEDIYFVIENIPKMKTIGYYNIPFYNYRQTNLTSITKSPYNLERFNDAINACLFVKDELLSKVSQLNDLKQNKESQKLKTVVLSFILKEFLYHYKMLNINSNLDSEYIHRKRLKELIDKNYYNNKSHDSYLKLANLLSVSSFEVIINLNKFKHKVLRTNQF